jgi:hypothetical protein
MANPEHIGDEGSARADQVRFMRQIRAEAHLLHAVAQEADRQMAAIVATAQRKRERLGRERNGSRPRERTGELGEDRQVGVQPNPVEPPDAER